MGGKSRDIVFFFMFSVVASSGIGSLVLFSPRCQHLRSSVGLLLVGYNISDEDTLTKFGRQYCCQQPFWHVNWFGALADYI